MRRILGYGVRVLAIVWTLQLLARGLTLVGVLEAPLSHSMGMVLFQFVAYIGLVWAAWWGSCRLLKPIEQASGAISEAEQRIRQPYLETQASRVALLVAMAGFLLWCIGLWLSGWHFGRYVDRSIDMPSYYPVRTTFFWVGLVALMGGAVGSVAYERTFGRLATWVRDGSRQP